MANLFSHFTLPAFGQKAEHILGTTFVSAMALALILAGNPLPF